MQNDRWKNDTGVRRRPARPPEPPPEDRPAPRGARGRRGHHRRAGGEPGQHGVAAERDGAAVAVAALWAAALAAVRTDAGTPFITFSPFRAQYKQSFMVIHSVGFSDA